MHVVSYRHKLNTDGRMYVVSYRHKLNTDGRYDFAILYSLKAAIEYKDISFMRDVFIQRLEPAKAREFTSMILA